MLVAGLQGVDEAENLLSVAACGEGVVDHRADEALGIDDKDTATGLGFAFAGHNHAVEGCHVLVEVGDDGKGNLDVEVFLDVSDPGDVGVGAVDAEAEEFDATSFEFGCDLRKGDELGSTDGGKVCGMREEDDPTALKVFEAQSAVRGLDLKGGSRLIETREGAVHFFLNGCIHDFDPFAGVTS